jgi:hypothetical protein
LGGEGWEAALGPILDFIEEQEVMIEVDTLVLGFTAPEEMNGGKCKAMR